MWFEAGAADGAARTGTLHTPHGTVATPAFMPVGTRGTVRALDPDDLREAGAQMVLANTYHLMLRPGDGVVEALGGLHGFMAWDGPILTDSGGYQVFSLEPRLDDDGVTFRSTYDGSEVRLTPEGSVAVQERLGADVAMVFDHLVGLPAPRDRVREAMHRTLAWSERALAAHRSPDQALFGIVQGGTDPELRAESAAATAALGFPGFGIGGLSVGEEAPERNAAIEAAVAELPAGRVRYVMGLGDTEGVLDAVARGCDLFDCVWPTRLARHGKVLTATGDYSIRRAEFTADDRPLEEGCGCRTCRTHSRAYLRHLLATGELLAYRLLSIHNLAYTLGVLRNAREAVAAGRLDAYRVELAAARARG
ncbi:MAG: tRNA guanosine(34) transglycosylase Tgt [Actinobacteria bacterium]|nr:tRNA guanosine(34) transglycosylase Tgt [Actinomycetota bacterium]